MSKIAIYRVSCRACNKEFRALSLKKAKALHREHIKTCDTILALEKVERFRRTAEKILGRKMTFKETIDLIPLDDGGKT